MIHDDAKAGAKAEGLTGVEAHHYIIGYLTGYTAALEAVLKAERELNHD